MHRMSFYFGTDVGEFMFPGLDVNGLGPLIGLCVALLLFSLLFEGVKILQTRSKSRVAREILHENSCPASGLLADEENQTQSQSRRNLEFRQRVKRTCLQTTIFLFQTTLGYLLMLSVMVYNAYVFIIIILGYTIGYFFFGHIAAKINMENVRAKKTHVICSPSCQDEPGSTCHPTNSIPCCSHQHLKETTDIQETQLVMNQEEDTEMM